VAIFGKAYTGIARGNPVVPVGPAQPPAHGFVPDNPDTPPVDPTVAENCGNIAETFPNKRILGNNAGLYFLHIAIPQGTSTATADIYFQLAVPSRFFMVVSMTTGSSADANAVFLSLSKTNKTYPSGPVTANGQEEWFCMKAFNNGGTANNAQMLELPEPVQDVYFTIGNEAGVGGTPFFITIAYSPERFNIQSPFVMNVG
jgi:hypothetical protein